MLSPALTTVAFDGAGNPYQVVYPCAPAYNSTALPLGVPDACAFELIPHRIFVGGFASATTESELRSIFERFGHVREAKVIRNGEGTPKGYGFVTFDSEEEAKAVIIRAEKEKLEFRGRRLNLGPAVRRTLRGPRFSQEYTLSTPTGQILPANGFGGFSYSYPQQSPYVVMSPTPTTPSFVFTPLPSTPSVFVYPYGASEHEDSQTQRQALTANAESVMPAASAAATVDQDPINQTTDAYPVAVCATPQMQQSPGSYCITPSASLISIAQPLTPVTPSVISQQMCGYPSGGAYYVPPGVQNIDMTHYSQMTPPVSVSCYFPPPNTFHFANTGAQSVAAPTSVNESLVPDCRQGQRFNAEWIPTGWRSTTQIGTHVCGSVNSVVPLIEHTNHLNRQRSGRRDMAQRTSVATSVNQYSA